MCMIKQSFTDRLIKDDQGKTTIFQAPNLPITIWGVLRLVNLLHFSATVHHDLQLSSTLVLLYWALLELMSGVNYLRKALGLVVAFMCILTLIKI